MKGLEINEKTFSVTSNNKDFRIDSQFYTQEPYENPSLEYEKIGNMLSKAQYGISISMNEEGIGFPIYRMNEIHNMLCDLDVSKFAEITSSEHKTFKLKDKDVLFNRTNSFEWVGRTGLYRKIDERDFVFASYLVRFNPDVKQILPEYLTAYLNTKYGIADIKRRARQSINQTNVNPEEVKEIRIPKLSLDFQDKISHCFDITHTNRLYSHQKYSQAETLLLETIGLNDFEPSKEKTNVKNFKESFNTYERLDSEFYLPKYDEIINKIKASGSWDKLENQITRIDTGEYSTNYYTKGDKDNLTFYIRSTNMKKGQVIKDDGYYVKKIDFVKIAQKGDILTSRVGSVGLFACVSDDIAGSVYSDNIIAFSLPNNFYPNAYTLLFNSVFYNDLIDRLARGSVQQRLNQETLKDLIIPIISIENQKIIDTKIQDSFALKKRSENLLELAKKAVEIAIEENEEIAIKYIETNLNKL